MLSALPQVLTPSAIAAADSLGTAQRSGTDGGSGFAALMQRQSELRMSGLRLSDLHLTEQRLAEQGQSQPRQTAPDARAGLNTGTGTTSTTSTTSNSSSSTPPAASSRPLDNSTENRNAASLSLNSKLQRARSAAPDATRQAAAGATPPRAGARHAPTAAAEEDSGSPAPEPNRPDEPLPDPTAATAASPPLPSAVAPDAEGVIQRGVSLSALGRTGPARLPVNSAAINTDSTDSSALPGRVSVSPGTVPADAVAGAGGDQNARRIGELAAANSGARASTLAPAGAGQLSGLRTGATAAADGLPGQGVTQAGEVVGRGGHDSAARPTRYSPVPASPGAETAVPTSPSPAADPTRASNPASAPTDSSASANASTNASTSTVQRAGPVAGAEPRRALATAAGPDGAAVSHRPAGGERVSALARDSANTEAIDPAALPANRRAAEPAKIAGPLASAEPVILPPSPAAANGAGPDNGLSRHPGQSVAASDAGPAGLTATAPAAAPAAALNRSDATGPNAAPVEARIAVPLDSPAFAPALGAQISLFARDGVQTARLQLNPAELGPIAVQIAVDGNAARIDFQADRAATREVIEASLPALAGALQDAGLTLTGGGVFQQHPGRQAPPEPGPATAAARLPASGTGLDAVAGGLAASSRQRTPRGLVDLVA